MKTKQSNRRKFLLAAGLGSAGVAAAVVAKGTGSAAGSAAAESVKQPSGYHVSEHILKYYKTTEV